MVHSDKGIENPHHVSIFKDSLGNECYFVIDTIFNGISVGGVRIHDGISLQEVKDLARHMSYKCALFDLPSGGAKVGIKLQDSSIKTRALNNFAKDLKPYMEKTIFFPGKDLGTSESDIALIYQGAGQVKYQGCSSYYTAIGVNSCLEFIKNRWGYRNLNVALSGFGDVGYFLVKEFIEHGIKLVALSNIRGCVYKKDGLDIQRLMFLKEQSGEDCILHMTKEILPKEALYNVPVDVLIIGAEAYAINNHNINNIRAKFICPVANIPYQAGITSRLKEKGIVFFPDFLTNAGGVLGMNYISRGLSEEEVVGKVSSKIYNMLVYLFRSSQDDCYDFALSLAADKVRLRNRQENKYKRIYGLRKKLSFLTKYIPARIRKNYYSIFSS